MPEELISQAAYARRRRISQQAVWKRTVTAGGPIPVHGPKKLLDVAEADALWDATKTDGTGHPALPGAVIDAAAYVRAKTAWMEARAQREALELRVRQGALLDRGRVEREQEAFAQRVRDGWLRWTSATSSGTARRG